MKRLWNLRWLRLSALLVAASLVLVAIPWVYRAWSEVPATSVDIATESEWIDRIKERGSITFRSWGGAWIGSDCDTDITFLPDDVVFMTEYRDGVSHYKGTYRADPSGQIKMRFEDFRHEWPVMVLERDPMSLRLRPKERGNGVVMRNRGGPTIIDGKGTYWPFRPVAAGQESQIRER